MLSPAIENEILRGFVWPSIPRYGIITTDCDFFGDELRLLKGCLFDATDGIISFSPSKMIVFPDTWPRGAKPAYDITDDPYQFPVPVTCAREITKAQYRTAGQIFQLHDLGFL